MSSPLGSIDERIKKIVERLANVDEAFRKKRLPGLRSLLDDYINSDVDVDDVKFHRGLLKVFKDSEDRTMKTYWDNILWPSRRKSRILSLVENSRTLAGIL